jgi:L-asparaginase II
MKPRHPVNVEVTRGPIVENRHQVIYVVTDTRGLIVDYHGNTDYVVTPRSSIKWLQAVPFVESGALEKWGLNEMHIALACASHKAQDHHLFALKKWMETIGVTDKDLECGPALPTNSSVSHNCSGKHLGFMSTAKMKGWEILKYTDYSHPIQELQKKWMSQLFGLDFMKLPHGGDGCGIPTFAVPLKSLAHAINVFVQSGTFLEQRKSLNRILLSLQKFPEYVSGQGDLLSRVAQISEGKCLIKSGADGVYTGLLLDRGYSFAVKCIDGSSRATELVVLSLIKKWGGLNASQLEKLKMDLEPVVLDSRSQKVGIVRIEPGSL